MNLDSHSCASNILYFQVIVHPCSRSLLLKMLYFSTWHLNGGWIFFLAGGALISVGPAKITPFKCCLFIICTINVQMHEPWVLMVDYTCGSYVSSLSLLQPSGDHSGIVQKRHFLHRATSKPVCPCSWASSFHIQVGLHGGSVYPGESCPSRTNHLPILLFEHFLVSSLP